MDAKLVAKEFKRVVWPVARVHGFSKIQGTTMWRYRDHGIDVFNLQGSKWNSLMDEPFEFFVNYGVHFTDIPDFGIRSDRGKLMPKEHECHFRRRLNRTEKGAGWELARNGDNLEAIFLELQAGFEGVVLPWYRKYWDLEEAVKTIQTEGRGVFSTPEWLVDYRIAHLALAMGRADEAERRLAAFLETCREEGVESPYVDLAVASYDQLTQAR